MLEATDRPRSWAVRHSSSPSWTMSIAHSRYMRMAIELPIPASKRGSGAYKRHRPVAWIDLVCVQWS